MSENPNNSFIKIKKEFQNIDIEIPVKTKWFIIALLLVFLGRVLFSVFSKSLRYSLDDMFYDMEYAIYFLSIALIVFVLGSIFVILWLLFGKEIIHVEKGILEIKKSLFGIGSQKRYEIDKIKNMGLNSEQESNKNETGKIRFDYLGKSVQFAGNIDETEAKEILETLKNSLYFKNENFQL